LRASVGSEWAGSRGRLTGMPAEARNRFDLDSSPAASKETGTFGNRCSLPDRDRSGTRRRTPDADHTCRCESPRYRKYIVRLGARCNPHRSDIPHRCTSLRIFRGTRLMARTPTPWRRRACRCGSPRPRRTCRSCRRFRTARRRRTDCRDAEGNAPPRRAYRPRRWRSKWDRLTGSPAGAVAWLSRTSRRHRGHENRRRRDNHPPLRSFRRTFRRCRRSQPCHHFQRCRRCRRRPRIRCLCRPPPLRRRRRSQHRPNRRCRQPRQMPWTQRHRPSRRPPRDPCRRRSRSVRSHHNWRPGGSRRPRPSRFACNSCCLAQTANSAPSCPRCSTSVLARSSQNDDTVGQPPQFSDTESDSSGLRGMVGS